MYDNAVDYVLKNTGTQLNPKQVVSLNVLKIPDSHYHCYKLPNVSFALVGILYHKIVLVADQNSSIQTVS